MTWIKAGFSFCILILTTLVLAGPPPGLISEEVDTDLYDCYLTITPPKTPAPDSGVRLTLEMAAGKGGVRVSILPGRLIILPDGKTAQPRETPLELTPETAHQLTVMRRGDWLRVLSQDKLIFNAQVPRAAGNQVTLLPGRGWTATGRVQRLEPVTFADNFMRQSNTPGPWTTQRGAWALQSVWDEDAHADYYRRQYAGHAQNPFAWVGNAATNASALCTTGRPSWEDYALTVAIHPAPDGAVGAVVNMPDAQSGLLVRWSAANDHEERGDRLAVYRLDGDRQTLLAEDPGGYLPGQWYQLTVTSAPDALLVAIDGRERLRVTAPSPWRGGVGLYAEGGHGSVFDDVSVYGRTLNTGLINESQATRFNDAFQYDRLGRMQKWATIQSDWAESPLGTNYWLHRHEFYGDHRLSLPVKLTTETSGELWLVLNANGHALTAGYRAVAQFSPKEQKIHYTLYRETRVLATTTGNILKPGVDYTFRFWHIGTRLWLEVDGSQVVTATDATPLHGQRPAYFAQGAFVRTPDTVDPRITAWAWTQPELTAEGLARVPEALVLGRQVRDYSFNDAPVDWWVGEGAWSQTVRWACSPGWSFLGGYGRGDVVLWQKSRFVGDQVFEAFLAVKMEYPRERDYYDRRYRDFAMTICGDGRDPRSGYAGILGAVDAQGDPNRRTVLLRNGVEVASAEIAVPNPGREREGHRDWFQLQLRKHGDTVEFWVLGKLALTYQDPRPIDGGVPAIWSNNNGFVIGRARLFFANPPQEGPRPRVVIDEPWYPEWVNLGTPLALDFPATWSATGKPAHIEVTPRETPRADAAAVTVAGTRLTFTPTVIGDHWYRITATDGENTSAGYHLTAPVFNPALKRDDAHALVLYRFDEGKGDVVQDHGTVTPPANLAIRNGTHWARGGRGVQIGGFTLLRTTDKVDKLLAIREKKACTLELWATVESIYPEFSNRGDFYTRWVGVLMSWENSYTQRNFTMGHQGEFFTFGGQSRQQSDFDKPFYSDGFEPGLTHLVITWDGATTRSYINGKLTHQQVVPWKPDSWSPDAMLILGNRSDGMRAFLGTLYLAAIHDTCFSTEQVLRHYQAGPDGK